MSQIGSRPPASGQPNPKVPSQKQVIFHRFGYAGASYLLVLAAVWIGDTRNDGQTYLYLAVSALALTLLTAITGRVLTALTGRGSVRLGWRSSRRPRRGGEDSIDYRSPAAGVVSDAGRRLTNTASPLPAWIRAEPRVWHFAPLVLLALWTLVALFRAS